MAPLLSEIIPDNMTFVANVASGLDGSDASLVLYNWTCPEVKPYAPIYFYQFTQPGEASQWTARFTVSACVHQSLPSVAQENLQITSPQGDSMPAPADTQPNGDSIAWGEGRLAGDTANKDDTPPVAHSKTLKERPSGSDSDRAASGGTGDDDSAISTDSDGGSGSNWRNSANKAAAEGSTTALATPSSTGPARPRKSRLASSHFAPTLSLPPALLAHTPSATPSDAPDDSDSNGAQHATASSFLVFVSFVSCLSFMRVL
jgi:hypothetical protein